MPASYDSIYFEISGVCNARCTFCHSGVQRPAKARFVDVDKFRVVLCQLVSKGAIRRRAVISLYNWGEPLLHPKLHQLVDVINDLGLRYAISTNASRVPKITPAFVRNLNHIIFSMPGYSRESYERIHGFDFDEIKGNISRIVRECRASGYRGAFSISFHVYKFNVSELKPCEDFASSLGIRFNPYYAILNNWWEINDYASGTLAPARKALAEESLFTLSGMEAVMKASPGGAYDCPQCRLLNIDESGMVATCCAIAKDHPDYACGDASSDNIHQILEGKGHRAVCTACKTSGMAYYLNTSLQTPDFYVPSWRQRLIQARAKLERLFENGARDGLRKVSRRLFGAGA